MASAKYKIKKNDTVMVVAGRDRGKTGKVIRTEPKKGRVYVEGLNIVKRHERPRSVKDASKGGEVGGIIEKEMPLAVAKVAIWNPGVKKADRIGIKTLADGKRVRFFKSNGEMLDV